MDKLTEGKIVEDIVKDIFQPRVNDIKMKLIRQAKEFVADSVEDIVETLLFKKDEGRRNKHGNVIVSNGGVSTNYTAFWASGGSNGGKALSRVKTVLISSYSDAVNVRNELMSYAQQYGKVSVADYYQVVDVATSSSDFNYGWKKDVIGDITIQRSGDGKGYVLNFPAPKPL